VLAALYAAPARHARSSRWRSRNVALRFVLVYTMPRAAIDEAVEDVTQALRERVLTVLPLHRFALEDVAAAHDAVEAGAVGKVVVDIP
jgi:NADPH2:quinone reductase